MTETIFQILQWAIPSGGIGAAIAWVANRRLHAVKAKKQMEDTYKQMYDLVSTELVGLQKQNHSNYEKMEELRSENDKTRRALNRLSRAIEAIQLCPHRLNCPVSGELSLSEDHEQGKSQRGKRVSSRLVDDGHERNDSNASTSADVAGGANTEDGLASPTSPRSKLHRTPRASYGKGVS